MYETGVNYTTCASRWKMRGVWFERERMKITLKSDIILNKPKLTKRLCGRRERGGKPEAEPRIESASDENGRDPCRMTREREEERKMKKEKRVASSFVGRGFVCDGMTAWGMTKQEGWKRCRLRRYDSRKRALRHDKGEKGGNRKKQRCKLSNIRSQKRNGASDFIGRRWKFDSIFNGRMLLRIVFAEVITATIEWVSCEGCGLNSGTVRWLLQTCRHQTVETALACFSQISAVCIISRF